MAVDIGDWKIHLGAQSKQDYFVRLLDFLKAEYRRGKIIYPPRHLWFHAFAQSSFAATKIIILGQDPYPNPGQAHGLCFSVAKGVDIPKSLQNIYRELADDVGFKPPDHGNLEHWAKQGVLLLNSVLTVEHKTPGAHAGQGWETFTDAVIKLLSTEKKHLVFMLWGNYAKQKTALIDQQNHLILKAAHPSPFSANAGFFGCRHFSRANDYLRQNGKTEIDWQS